MKIILLLLKMNQDDMLNPNEINIQKVSSHNPEEAKELISDNK